MDYSNLNNAKKGLDGGGESGQTFTGMMNWVDREVFNRPVLSQFAFQCCNLLQLLNTEKSTISS